MTINTETVDRFGFYQTETQKFYSKFEGLYNCKDTDKITWNFNRSTYDFCKWDEEPASSLDDLYRKRAEQLREKYDHIVLLYSGGADSDNILNTFINNNIKLEEVASLVNYEGTGDKLNWLNAEIFHVAGPKIEAARAKQPELVHTIVDTVPIIQEMFRNAEAKFDWIYDVNKFTSPYNASRRYMKMSQPHWADLINAGKRVCFLHGLDKPQVIGIKDSYYFRFNDIIDIAVPPSIQRLNRPWEFDELFYWTPDMPELVIKMAHVIKKFLKHAPVDSPYLSTEKSVPTSSTKIVNGKTMYLHIDMVHKLLYTGWYAVPYQFKPRSIVLTPRDEWIYSLPENDPTKYTWRVGLEELWRATPDIYKNDPTRLDLGFKTMFSGPYHLGK